MDTFVNLYFQLVVFIILPALIYGAIFRKAGYSGLLGVLMIIPIVNLIVLIWFASAMWPLEMGYERESSRGLSLGNTDRDWELKMSMRKAIALEKRGLFSEAIKEFEWVKNAAAGKPLAELAETRIGSIREKMGPSKADVEFESA